MAMVRWRRLASTGALALALLVAGCSGDEGDSGERGSPGSVDSGSSEGGGGADGDDFAVPLAAGAEAVARSESGLFTVVQFIVPLAQRDAAIAFYDDWTQAQPDDYQRTASDGGGVSWQNAPDAEADKIIIVVLAPLEGDDFVAITLTVGPVE